MPACYTPASAGKAYSTRSPAGLALLVRIVVASMAMGLLLRYGMGEAIWWLDQPVWQRVLRLAWLVPAAGTPVLRAAHRVARAPEIPVARSIETHEAGQKPRRCGISRIGLCPDHRELRCRASWTSADSFAVVQRQATRLGLPAMVMTFDPHPEEYFRGADSAPRLTDLTTRYFRAEGVRRRYHA